MIAGMISLAAVSTGDAAGTAAIVAAVVAGVIALLTFWLTGVRQERGRRRQFYADALEATLAYREFAYAVRRRRHDQPEAERIRISEAMRDVQREMARYEALMRIERARNVHAQYAVLVSKTREIAGGYIRTSWNADPITKDSGMNIDVFDFSALGQFVTAYTNAVAEDLAWWRFWR